MKQTPLIALVVVGMSLAFAAPTYAATNVAVFNFQMKSETPEWRWLEKGLADRITTDFVSERGLSVVARDEMQAWAQKVKWTPEMALLTSAEIEEIWQHLQIQYVVTGVFTVSGDRISVTAQIVEMLKRQEVARKEVSGSRDNVLELQRQVSAAAAWAQTAAMAAATRTTPQVLI